MNTKYEPNPVGVCDICTRDVYANEVKVIPDTSDPKNPNPPLVYLCHSCYRWAQNPPKKVSA